RFSIQSIQSALGWSLASSTARSSQLMALALKRRGRAKTRSSRSSALSQLVREYRAMYGQDRNCWAYIAFVSSCFLVSFYQYFVFSGSARKEYKTVPVLKRLSTSLRRSPCQQQCTCLLRR